MAHQAASNTGGTTSSTSASSTSASSTPAPHVLYSLFPHLKLLEKTPDNKAIIPYNGRLQAGEVVILYFSAHWCPPCQQYTPHVCKYAGKCPPGGVRFVFVSRDKSLQEFEGYFKEMSHDFLAVDFSAAGLRDQLCINYGVNGIPSIHLISNLADAASCYEKMRDEIMRPQTMLKQMNFIRNELIPACYANEGYLHYMMQVKILFLDSRPYLNGQIAQICGYKGMDRIIVEPVPILMIHGKRTMVEDDARIDFERIALRRRNLFPLEMALKKNRSIRAWQSNVVEPMDIERNQYRVLVDGGKLGTEVVDKMQVRWGLETPVVVHGLTSRPEKNGLMGTIVQEYDEETERYAIKINAHETLMLKGDKFYV
ncbi:unnamed protein product [Amoebophrya sp. A25]|nr:unnamed protein product [Amoebophrya sp. A25]|eukprot:GSA25T00003583001.1